MDTEPKDQTPDSAPAPDDVSPANDTATDSEDLREKIIEVLKTCYDPEIPVDIYALGLIYKIDVQQDGQVKVDMTLTSPACPVAGTLPPEVEQKINSVPGVRAAKVDVVWDPPWDMDMMTESARLVLNI